MCHLRYQPPAKSMSMARNSVGSNICCGAVLLRYSPYVRPLSAPATVTFPCGQTSLSTLLYEMICRRKHSRL